MLTDRPPRTKALLTRFIESDQMIALELPRDDRLRGMAHSIESAMESGVRLRVQAACAEFFSAASAFYGVSKPDIRALAARPLRVREGGWSTELFGDYTPGTRVIRVWTRTAVQKRVTSFGTFFSTLCHEFCHHLDCERFGFTRTPHTRGFYQRTAILYHHARGTPMKNLCWIKMPRGQWRIDWQKMRAVTPQARERGTASDAALQGEVSAD